MALTRVQSTGQVTGGLLPGFVSLTFPTPPTIGHAIVVLVSVYRGAGSLVLPPTACTDNHGNVYALAVAAIEPLGQDVGAAVYVCGRVTASGSPFTVTVANGQAIVDYTVCALEIGGAPTTLLVHRTTQQTGRNRTLADTGTTPPIAATTVLEVAVHSNSASVAALTVAAVTPSWIEEYESLTIPGAPGAACGEADSRIRTSAAGTTAQATWTKASLSDDAAVLVVFAPDAPPAVLAAFGNRSAGLDQALTINQRNDGTNDVSSPGRLAVTTAARVAITAPDDLYVNDEGVLTGLSGDVTAAGPGIVPATIAADAVTYAKLQNVSAASRLLGRGSAAGAGDPQELSLGAHLTLTGTTLAADIDGGIPAAHAPTHSSGGTDPVTVTALAGYPGGTTTFLRADHTFAAPGSGAAHYDCPLSDGDLVAADLIFAAGECVIVQVPV